LQDEGIYCGNMGLDPEQFQVSMGGVGGLSLANRCRLHSRDTEFNHNDLVILDIGSNDLCDKGVAPEQFALNLMSYAAFLMVSFEVKKVVVLQILRRQKEPFRGYNERVIEANQALEALAHTSDQKIYFWKHRGMWNCAVNIYCYDGVHLSRLEGYKRYERSLRDCIIRVSKW